jgi:uncharacterized membrane protein YfcA
MIGDHLHPTAVLVTLVAFLMGGFIKGLSGLGMPMVALPILSLYFSVPQAVALTMVPILVSNGWQAFSSGGFGPVLRRFWPMQLIMAVALTFSASLMVRLDNALLLVLGGAVLMVSILGLMLSGGRSLPAVYERPVGILVALVAGAISIVSSLFGIVIIIYLSSLSLARAEFVTTISIIYFFAGLPYLAGLLAFDVMQPVDLIGSALATIPAMLGLMLATRLTHGIVDESFRKMLRVVLIGLGGIMILRGMTGG